MSTDINGVELNIGDRVHVPDNWYPFRVDDTGRSRYGSVCRTPVITRHYMDSTVTITFNSMYDMLELGRGTFEHSTDVYSRDLTLAMTAEEYENRGVPATVAPYVVGVGGEHTPQPRDAQGRFTSSNTTQRPTVQDRQMAEWITSMTQTAVLS